MKRRDVVKAIWKMGRGNMIGEWVEAIADEFMALQSRIVKLEMDLVKARKAASPAARI